MDNLPILSSPPLPSVSGGTGGGKEATRKTGKEFEALFIQQMLQAMRSTVPDGGLVKKDNASRIYEDMLDAERARIMARQQSLGLTEALERQVERQRPRR